MSMADSDPLDRWLDDGGSSRTANPRRRFAPRTHSNPWPGLLERAQDLGDEFRRLVAAQIDLTRVRLRDTAIQVGLLALGGLLVLTMAIVALVLVLSGLGTGLGLALGGRIWLGNVLTGLLTLGAIAGAVFFYIARMRRASLRQQMEKYERPGASNPNDGNGRSQPAQPENDRAAIPPRHHP